MIKELIEKYGEFVLGMASAIAVILLLKWMIFSGPLYDLILKFTDTAC